MTAAKSPRLVAALYAFTAGYVDTVGFVGLFGLFTAHVTGNFVLIGASIAQPRSGLIAKLAALPVFVLVVAATGAFLRRCNATGRDPARGVLAVQAGLLLLFMAVAVITGPFADGDKFFAILAGLFGVAAMAIQNAASRTVFAALSPTTVMTGNVTQIVLDLTELIQGSADDEALKGRVRKMLPAVIAFAIGAVTGGLAFAGFGFWALIAPLSTIVGLFLLLAPVAHSVSAAQGNPR